MPQTPAEKPEGGTALTRVLMVAGEASGDLHGASLAKSMRALSDNIEILGVGGDRMQAAGVELLYHMKNLAVVGITEVLRHLGDVRAALRALTHAAETRAVDAVTPKGRLYRVDLRLRPEGAVGSLARSLTSSIAYYRRALAIWFARPLPKGINVNENRIFQSLLQ